jgi:PAS domain S-box-containing protein
MPALIAAFDWSRTSVGPIETWPRSLRTTVGVVLRSPVPIVLLWGRDGVMIYNDAYSVFAGRRHPTRLGMKVLEGWPEVADFNANVMRVGLAGGTLSYKDQELTLFRTGEAEQVWMDLDYSPVLDDSEEPAGVIAIVVETSERVRAERQQSVLEADLRVERDRARGVLENMGEAFILLDRDYRVVDINAEGARMEHRAREDIIGLTQWEAWPNTTESPVGAISRHAMAAREPMALEHCYVWPGGHNAWLDLRVYPAGDGIAMFYRDITARRRDEEALRQSEQRLRDLNADLELQVLERARERGRTWQVSPDLLSVVNADGYLESTNPAWTHVLGWTQADLASRPFDDFIHPEDRERTGLVWAEALAGQPILRFENRYRARDGQYRWLSWVAVPEEGKVYCSARDVTAEKEQAAELALAQEALRQSQKMEAVGQLTGGLAHDFNNLLAGISGSLERLQTRIAQGRINDLDRYISAAQGAARRAAALTHRLLAFSRRQTLDPKPTDVNRLVAGMEELIKRTMGPEITIQTTAGPELWTTLVDPGQLENALLNLCINARDAMPGGGTLKIYTENRWLDDRAAKEHEIAPGQYVLLCVSDTGAGMRPEVIARAFDPFYTTKPIGQGTGLGLSMVYGFVHQSGGQVVITSEVGQGTTLCLYLPRHMGQADSGEAPAGEAGEPPRAERGETVLVVDDEATVRMLVTEVLQDLGYAAIEAEDGMAGLKILQSGVRVDLLVTDVGLPGGMNGRQFAEAARMMRRGLRVLFITGYAENTVLSHGHLEPGMQVLTKPFGMETLATRIRALIGGTQSK